jgi:threonine/homoserine/homoserine lactone efflux protein
MFLLSFNPDGDMKSWGVVFLIGGILMLLIVIFWVVGVMVFVTNQIRSWLRRRSEQRPR